MLFSCPCTVMMSSVEHLESQWGPKGGTGGGNKAGQDLHTPSQQTANRPTALEAWKTEHKPVDSCPAEHQEPRWTLTYRSVPVVFLPWCNEDTPTLKKCPWSPHILYTALVWLPSLQDYWKHNHIMPVLYQTDSGHCYGTSTSLIQRRMSEMTRGSEHTWYAVQNQDLCWWHSHCLPGSLPPKEGIGCRWKNGGIKGKNWQYMKDKPTKVKQWLHHEFQCVHRQISHVQRAWIVLWCCHGPHSAVISQNWIPYCYGQLLHQHLTVPSVG